MTSLNELEVVDGAICANVFPTNRIACIDPASGRVRYWVDLSGLLPPALRPGRRASSPQRHRLRRAPRPATRDRQVLAPPVRDPARQEVVTISGAAGRTPRRRGTVWARRRRRATLERDTGDRRSHERHVGDRNLRAGSPEQRRHRRDAALELGARTASRSRSRTSATASRSRSTSTRPTRSTRSGIPTRTPAEATSPSRSLRSHAISGRSVSRAIRKPRFTSSSSPSKRRSSCSTEITWS